MEEKRTAHHQWGEWILWRLVTWGFGSLVGLAVAAFLLPRPTPEAFGVSSVGPAQVSWGFIATAFGCLTLGLLLWRDPSWPNKVTWAISLALAIGVIAPEEARVIASIVGFVVPVLVMILKAFFGRERAPGVPAAAEVLAQPGAGIGFQAGIGLGGAEQIDLAGVLRDRERAAADNASAQLLGLCDQLQQRGGRMSQLAEILAERLISEQLARRGIQVRLVEEEEAEERPTPKLFYEA